MLVHKREPGPLIELYFTAMNEEWVTATFGSQKGKPKELAPKEALELALRLIEAAENFKDDSARASKLRQAHSLISVKLNKVLRLRYTSWPSNESPLTSS